LSWFDDNCTEYYIKEPEVEKIKQMRGGDATASKQEEPPKEENPISEFLPLS
jgi:hypothetical protein